jgi:NitT/TauT family transport system substrate-binding protein
MRRLRFILNTFYSGPQAWFFVADVKGYFREEGLEIDFFEGDTLANAVPRIARGEFEAGYGDLNALIELAAQRPDSATEAVTAGLREMVPAAPVRAVFAMHNASPYTIAIPADSALYTPQDLQGATLASHPNDAALRLLPELARHTGLDATSLRLQLNPDPHPALLRDMLEKAQFMGLFGFVNTLKAAAIEAGIDWARRLRFIEYRTYLPDLYGAALMVSSALADQEPQVVRGLVRAVNRGLADTLQNPVAAIEAVAARNPALNRAANLARLQGTLALEMAHPEGARLGIGEVDDARLGRAIALIVQAKGYPGTPLPGDVFSRAFLPPLADRVTALGAV